MHRLPLLVLLPCAAALAQGQPVPTTIAVVDAATGHPCPAATVWVLGIDHPSYFVPRDPLQSARERFARDGTALRTDERGEVRVPVALAPGGIAEVAALAGDRWCQCHPPWPPRPRLVLAVEADPVVAVRLLGPDDRPAAIAVLCGSQGGDILLRVDPTTGLAHFRPTALRMQGAWTRVEEGRIDDAARIWITLDAVTAVPIAIELDPGLALPAQVTLRAPACGSLRVKVVDAKGAPIARGHAHAGAIDPTTGRCGALGTWREIRDGEARFDAVALGLEVQVQVGAETGPHTNATIAGPAKPGEEIVATVATPAQRADGRTPHDITGRLLAPDGTPMARCGVHLVVDRNVSGSHPVRASAGTDDAGAFTVTALGPFDAGNEILIAVMAPGNQAGRPVDHFAVRPLQHARAGTELGDVRTARAPLLVAGRVLDTFGNAVRARIEVQRDGHPDTDDPSLPGTTGATDQAGRFALHASFATSKPLHVRCRTELGTEQFVQTVAPGRSDVVFTVPARTAVSGQLRLADARQSRHLHVLMVPAAADPDPWCGPQFALATAPVAADGSFATWPVEAGKYHLVVRLANAFELARVVNIEVPPDGAVRDPRLAAIDLTSALREVTVTVDAGDRAIGACDELSFEPAPGSWKPPQLVRPGVVAAMRARPLRVWLPPGPFTVQARRSDARSAAEAALSPAVDIRDGAATVVLTR